MAAKRALVVDDSKSARVVLSRMLEKYGIEVDTADSAEAALDYLRSQRPDVVFMDHMMTGMNGLEAVQAMKANPDTAGIPVMMYTSQEGELYAGQARAIGAMGVLPKTVKPIDVTKVLYQLNLLPDRRDGAPSALQPVEEPGVTAAPGLAEPVADTGETPAEAQGGLASEARIRQLVEALLKEQSIELRRFMVAALDSHAHRVFSELRHREPEASAEPPTPPPPPPAPRRWPWVLATLAALLALGVVALQYSTSLETAREVDAARARLEVESAALRATLAEVRKASAAAAAMQSAPVQPAPQALPSREVPRPQVLRVPFGEAWLTGPRLDALRAMVAQLERAGFRGTVRAEVFAGQFCLAGEDGDYELAADATPVAKCDLVGNPASDPQGSTERAPLAFVNLAATVSNRTGGRMQLAVARGNDHDDMAYPGTQSTAGRWNEAAAANNRLEITVVPR